MIIHRFQIPPVLSGGLLCGFALLCALIIPMVSGASIPGDSLATIHKDLAAGRADDAISILSSSLAADPQNAAAHHFLCRVYYQEQRWDEAIHECESSVQLAPTESVLHLWLGRAYGGKANSIHSLKAYGLAKKVRSEFERAVQLDPGNVDALSDLGDFYALAPGLVGGSKSKAQEVVHQLQKRGAAQAHQLEAQLAEKDKNYGVAESELKAAVTTSGQSADTRMALAAFYGRRQQWDRMLQAVNAGIDADAHAAQPDGPALVDGAALLSRYHREPQLAMQMLTRYLASANQSDQAPAFQVHMQLSRLLEEQGNHDGAQQHLQAAESLARGYHPAPPRSIGG